MGRPVAALLLVLALLFGAAEHVHAGASDGGSCPACQLERTTPAPESNLAVTIEPPAIAFLAPAEPGEAPPPTLAPLTVAPKTSPPRS